MSRVEMVRPLPATTATTTTTTIATPIAKLELNGCHGPPLLLPQTQVAKQEIIERPLSGLSGLKHPHLGSKYALECEDGTCVGVFNVAYGSGLGVEPLSFAFAIGRLRPASSYEIIGEFEDPSSATGRR